MVHVYVLPECVTFSKLILWVWMHHEEVNNQKPWIDGRGLLNTFDSVFYFEPVWTGLDRIILCSRGSIA